MKKWILCGLLAMILLIIGMMVYGRSAQENLLRVGNMPVAVGVPLQYAYDQGWFKDAGLDIEIVMFPTGVPINEAFAADELDVSVIGLAGVYGMANDVSKWIAEANIAGGCGIYVRSDSEIAGASGNVPNSPTILGSAGTVRGKRFLVPLGTSAQYNVIKYVEKLGLSPSDITLVQMEYGPGLQAFLSGEGDAYASGPPFTFQAEEAGAICVSTHEDATDGLLIDGIAARLSVCETRKDDLVKFLQVYFKAAELMATDEALRFEVSMKFFNDNGREYNENSLRQEISVKKFITPDMLSASDFVYGKGLLDMANFFTSDGKVKPDDIPKVIKNLDPSILEEALDIKINKVQN